VFVKSSLDEKLPQLASDFGAVNRGWSEMKDAHATRLSGRQRLICDDFQTDPTNWRDPT